MNLAPITLIGNLTSDPEITFTSSGQSRLAFSVAVNHIWYDQNQEKQEKPSYFNVVAWRYLADNSVRTLEKGIGVVVVGRLEQRSYDDKEGNKRSVVEVVAEEIAIATKSIEGVTRRTAKAGEAGSPQGGSPRPQQQGSAAQRRQRPAMSMVGSSSQADENPAPEGEPF
jgi:single-strand DNA-binding protein